MGVSQSTLSGYQPDLGIHEFSLSYDLAYLGAGPTGSYVIFFNLCPGKVTAPRKNNDNNNDS